MKRTITKTELRKNSFYTNKMKTVFIGFYVDDEPFFCHYTMDEFDNDLNYETKAIQKFINEDLKTFYEKELKDLDIQIYYKERRIA